MSTAVAWWDLFNTLFVTNMSHLIQCGWGGFPGRATTWSTLWVHFVRCHVQDTLEVLEEGSHPHPHCIKCDIFVTYRVLNRSHQATAMCYS